jgi:hypothetical protein
MAAAGALGVEGVDGAALEGAMVSSTKPDSFSVSVWIITCTSNRRRRQAVVDGAGVVPQSSCSFSAQAPAEDHLLQRAGSEALPLPAKAEVHREGVGRLDHPLDVPGAGVQVVASVPCAGPVPPPSMVVTPLISASSICCGQMKWMWLSMPPAVRILPSPAMPRCPGR